MKCWFVFVTIAVVVSATRAQDYYDEDIWDWQSDEDTSDNKDLDNKKEEPFSEDAVNYDYSDKRDYDDVNLPDDDQAELDEDNEGLNKDGDAAEESHVGSDETKALLESDSDLNENVSVDDLPAEDKDIDQIVKEQIDQIQEELDEPNSAIDKSFDDYQVEDNRSDKGEIPLKNIENNSESFEPEDSLEVDPVDDVNIGLNYPEFGEVSDSVEINKEESPDVQQIIEDANRLLNEDNGVFEEDIENENKSQEDSLASLETIEENRKLELDSNENNENYSNENKEDENIVLLQKIKEQGSLGELDENSQEDTAVEDKEQEFKSDEEEGNKEIEIVNQKTQDQIPLGELDENSQEDTAVEDIEKYKDNKDVPAEPADDNKELSISSVKYENDMIDPKEVEEEVNDSDDDADANGDNVEGTYMSEEDTVDKAYKDLNDDLGKLFATWDKLTSDDSSDEIKELGSVSREKPEDDDMSNIDEPAEDGILDEDFDREQTVLRDREELDKYIDKYGAEDSLEDDLVSNEYENDENIFAFDTDIGVSDEKEVLEQDADDKLNTEEESNKSDAKEVEEKILPMNLTTVKTIDVEDLTPEQYNDLMTQFAIVHANELDTQAEDFGKNTAAIHMTLTAEESIEITSPNFPNTYPTNNVVDWILEGEGTGIEINITDLEIRGAQNDFLLVKPGGLDANGDDGLIFSYQLNTPRRYRYTDVNRVFIRFQSGAGLGFLKGFRMTVKNIWPADYFNPEEDLPEPEPLLPSPTATFTVNLAGISVFDFNTVKPDFLRIIADMATMYINANEIDAGLNSTLETAQITSVSSCKANWPNFENCVAVSFGVPLVYADDDEEIGSRLNETDLADMWTSNVNRDPFAARLRAMGISEFDVPNDNRMLLVWVILTVGIVISAAIVAFALWRYSCFEDYTRMKSFSDTDSISNEKRGLDLYPTPHQTLPPLYAEQDYKWDGAKYEDTTRVDLGGFTNRSYARDELLDIYSDEDARVQRDGNASFAPRDIYQV